jgi:hypothetical protein
LVKIFQMSKSELIYWEKQRNGRSLIITIRSYKTRAIRFFGAMDVLSENEMELIKTLESRIILEMSDQELLNKIGAIPSEVFEGVSNEEIDSLRRELKITTEGVSELKAIAKKHLTQKLLS